MYSLDPWNDPHGSLLHLDYLSIKSGMHQWLLDVFDVFIERRNDHGYEEDARLDPTVLPGWVYARALALRMVENASKTQVLSSNLQVWIQTLEAQIVERIIRKVRWH
jgi:hypothetical protein